MSSEFRKALRESSICLHLRGRSSDAVIDEMVGQLVADGRIGSEQRAEVTSAVLEREGRLPTGLELTVAAPHGKTDAVVRLVTAVGVHPEGVDFGALDGKLARIVILTVSRRCVTGPHVAFLSEISRVLQEAEVREQIVNAHRAETVVAALLEK